MRYFTTVTHFFMGYRSAISIFGVVLPSQKPLYDIIVHHFFSYSNTDWGEVKLRIGGKPVTFTMAVFALCHSEGRWAYRFRHQDNLACR